MFNYFLCVNSQAKTQDLVTADFVGNGGWGDDDPSVFLMGFVGAMQGEFQVTNGYGPEKAPQVMRVSVNLIFSNNASDILTCTYGTISRF